MRNPIAAFCLQLAGKFGGFLKTELLCLIAFALYWLILLGLISFVFPMFAFKDGAISIELPTELLLIPHAAEVARSILNYIRPVFIWLNLLSILSFFWAVIPTLISAHLFFFRASACASSAQRISVGYLFYSWFSIQVFSTFLTSFLWVFLFLFCIINEVHFFLDGLTYIEKDLSKKLLSIFFPNLLQTPPLSYQLISFASQFSMIVVVSVPYFFLNWYLSQKYVFPRKVVLRSPLAPLA